MLGPAYPILSRRSAIAPGTACGWVRFGANTHPKHAPPELPGF